MKIEKLFLKNLKQTIRDGHNHESINCLCGCTNRKVVLTKAEAEAGKQTYEQFMAQKLWNECDDRSWLFGSPKTMLNIGLIPLKLAQNRLGLNSHCWQSYNQIY